MRYLGWALAVTAVTLFAAFLHYTLPHRDVVQITRTFNRIVQFGENSIFWSSPDVGSSVEAGNIQRDVLFIDALRRNGNVIVFRNEDTGFIWPPYFKYTSSNVQAQANNLISRPGEPEKWAIVTYYGWRIPWLSVFPNIVSVREAESRDQVLIPWFNIIFLTVLFAIIWAITVRVRRFLNRRVRPRIAEMDAAIGERREGVSRWLSTWRSKPRR